MAQFEVSSEQKEAFARDGFFVTAPLFTETELAPVRSAISVAWQRRRQERTRSEEARWDRLRPELPRLHAVDEHAAEFCRSPVFAAIAAAFIGPNADMMWNQAHVKAPDEAGMTAYPWHQDGAYVQMENPATISCWTALTRCDGRNGALVFAPGSQSRLLPHIWDDELKYLACQPAGEVRQLELEVGQIVVFGAATAHCSAPNRGDAPRFAYSLSFSLPEARLLPSRTPFGDQVPVLRGGRLIDDVMRDFAMGTPDSTNEVGQSVLDSMRARLPRQRDAIDAAVVRVREAARAGDPRRFRRSLSALFAISEEDVNINGDLVRARNDADAIVREYANLGADIPRFQRQLLLLRALELDPGHAGAREQLRRLESEPG